MSIHLPSPIVFICASRARRLILVCLNQVLRPEVGAQVHDLPAPEGDEQGGGADAEPLDAGVGALVGVAQLLLAGAQVVHLVDDLLDHLLDAAQVRLDGAQLLGGLDGGPVLGVGADVDVQLDVARGVVVSCWCEVQSEPCVRLSRRRPSTGARKERLTSLEYVLEAHIEGGVGVRREYGSLLAGDVSRAAVLVTDGVSDLQGGRYGQGQHEKKRKKSCFPGIRHGRTCMLTVWPSPFDPLTMAVTTTNVSLATKFRMHRSFLPSRCGTAARSNLRASTDAMSSTMLQTYRSRARGKAIMGEVPGDRETMPDGVTVRKAACERGRVVVPGLVFGRSKYKSIQIGAIIRTSTYLIDWGAFARCS